MDKKETAFGRIKKWAIVVVSVIILGLFAWIVYETIQRGNLGFDKTLWEWMELLIVPSALAVGGLLFSRYQKQYELDIAEKQREEDRRIATEKNKGDREIAAEENKTDRDIALERQRQSTLENYFDRMSALILEHDLVNTEDENVINIARARTHNILNELQDERNRQIITFLSEASLLNLLSGAILRGADLRLANLSEANLSEADLRGAKLIGAKLIGANLIRANLIGTDLRIANLIGADLRLARLRLAKLSEANLSFADLSQTDLSEADLSGADLSDVITDSDTKFPDNFQKSTPTDPKQSPSLVRLQYDKRSVTDDSPVDSSDVQSDSVDVTEDAHTTP